MLFIGDVVASPGRAALKAHVKHLREQHQLDVVVVNAENAASGRGITTEVAQEIFATGVDVITLGDHTFDQKGVEDLLSSHPRVIRPANFPAGTVGRGHTTFTLSDGRRLGVINLQGRVFMNKNLVDCPFQLSKELQKQYVLAETCDALIVDVHAEATSEKAVLGHIWDGKASLVVGTHTHIPTADHRIMPGGTAFQSDAGMCGNYNSSLGVTFESCLPGFTTAGRTKFEQSTAEATLCGTIVQVGPTGLAQTITPIRIGGCLLPTAEDKNT